MYKLFFLKHSFIKLYNFQSMYIERIKKKDYNICFYAHKMYFCIQISRKVCAHLTYERKLINLFLLFFKQKKRNTFYIISYLLVLKKMKNIKNFKKYNRLRIVFIKYVKM